MRIETIVDKLGEVKAQIADLQEKEAEMRQTLIDAGVEEVEGKMFRVTVSRATVTKVDYKGIVEFLDVPERTIGKYTTESERVTVSVKARTGKVNVPLPAKTRVSK